MLIQWTTWKVIKYCKDFQAIGIIFPIHVPRNPSGQYFLISSLSLVQCLALVGDTDQHSPQVIKRSSPLPSAPKDKFKWVTTFYNSTWNHLHGWKYYLLTQAYSPEVTSTILVYDDLLWIVLYNAFRNSNIRNHIIISKVISSSKMQYNLRV